MWLRDRSTYETHRQCKPYGRPDDPGCAHARRACGAQFLFSFHTVRVLRQGAKKAVIGGGGGSRILVR